MDRVTDRLPPEDHSTKPHKDGLSLQKPVSGGKIFKNAVRYAVALPGRPLYALVKVINATILGTGGIITLAGSRIGVANEYTSQQLFALARLELAVGATAILTLPVLHERVIGKHDDQSEYRETTHRIYHSIAGTTAGTTEGDARATVLKDTLRNNKPILYLAVTKYNPVHQLFHALSWTRKKGDGHRDQR